MRIEFTSEYKELERLARDSGCYLMSVQAYYVFFNFRQVEDAERFIQRAQRLTEANLSINTMRGQGGPLHIPAEVAVPHKQWV